MVQSVLDLLVEVLRRLTTMLQEKARFITQTETMFWSWPMRSQSKGIWILEVQVQEPLLLVQYLTQVEIMCQDKVLE
jgi:hypothetical protein